MSVWWNGRVAGDGDVPLADDRGLLLGDGLFETVLVVRGVAALLPRHLARMTASAAALRLALPGGLASTVTSALPQLFEHAGRPDRGALRITVTSGRGRGLSPGAGPPGLVISLTPVGAAPARPLSVRIVAAPRVDPLDPLAGHKTLSSMGRVLARRAALALGDDAAILTTLDGDVCEADAANVFAVTGGVVVTPSLDRGVLPGITRARSLAALASAGRSFEERRLPIAEMLGASEVFVTSSLLGVRAVGRIDGAPRPGGGNVAGWLARCLEG